MALITFHKILLKGRGDRHKEKRCVTTNTILPGHLIEEVYSGGELKVQLQSANSAPCMGLFAIENSYEGASIDDLWTTETPVRYLQLSPGDVVYAMLKAGQTLNPGQWVTPFGDGTFIAAANASVAGALGTNYEEEVVDNSAGATAMRFSLQIK